jgi:hypothetical protein
MARFAAIVALSISLIGLAGCAHEWTRPGTSEQQLNADQLECEQDAMKSYPVIHDAPVSYRAPVSSRLDTNCVQQSGFNNCDASGNAGAASAAAHGDASDHERAAAVRACMTSKGYTYKKAAR